MTFTSAPILLAMPGRVAPSAWQTQSVAGVLRLRRAFKAAAMDLMISLRAPS